MLDIISRLKRSSAIVVSGVAMACVAACGASPEDANLDQTPEALKGPSAAPAAPAATCRKGTTGNQVAVIGDSLIALNHGVTTEIEKDAQGAGSLAPGSHYVDRSTSGAGFSQIATQYRGAQASYDIKYVIMDGGGIECMSNQGSSALSTAQSLFKTMAQDGVQKVVYAFYADPLGSSFASLKSCFDGLRPKMKALCDGLTSPKCFFVDLRSTWSGHSEYTADGVNPTAAGSVATGDAVWKAMTTNCVAQ